MGTLCVSILGGLFIMSKRNPLKSNEGRGIRGKYPEVSNESKKGRGG